MPDKNFSSSLCLEACDMGKILSDATLCLAILAVLFVEFEAVVHLQQEPKLVFYDWKPQILARITL